MSEVLSRPLPQEALFTDDELAAWHAVAEAANALFALPLVNPFDEDAILMEIHSLQNRLLSRMAFPLADRTREEDAERTLLWETYRQRPCPLFGAHERHPWSEGFNVFRCEGRAA